MTTVRGVLFDFHETLVSADRWMAMEIGGIALELLETLGVWDGGQSPQDRRGVEETYAHLRTISVETALEYSAQEVARVLLRALGITREIPEATLTAAVEGLFRRYIPDVTMKDQVPDTLQMLARRGYRMGVVSNAAYGPFLSWALEAIGLRRYFEQIIVSADVGIRKPRREIFAAALEAMRLTAREAVYVGNDYIKDVMGAKLAGLGAIWVPGRSALDYRVFTPVHPDAVADRFEVLPEILTRWSDG